MLEKGLAQELVGSIEERINLLEQRFRRYEVDRLDPNTNLRLLQQIHIARSQGQLAFQAIQEEQALEQQGALIDNRISRNNDLWRMRLGLSLGLLTLGGLYVWLMRTSGQQTRRHHASREPSGDGNHLYGRHPLG